MPVSFCFRKKERISLCHATIFQEYIYSDLQINDIKIATAERRKARADEALEPGYDHDRESSVRWPRMNRTELRCGSESFEFHVLAAGLFTTAPSERIETSGKKVIPSLT